MDSHPGLGLRGLIKDGNMVKVFSERVFNTFWTAQVLFANHGHNLHGRDMAGRATTKQSANMASTGT